ncbi:MULTISPECIES: phage/plasmid primase, P4 family [Stenotrophomonas]|uniref:DNA primase family protein n=1 Tax=Stenotrophomonas TaxID=40323 RepID=UPI001CF549CC|nr:MULTISPECIES: phage/plasmid primase, P4 family [Stenotrophomonas]MCA7024388.1 phage/plasmid primase, P4 family [Stenotrophomonas acidaminiphila]MCE4076259.1 phage/plasmid primase, P4 family [Stenotrophomonas acidaminiphila]
MKPKIEHDTRAAIEFLKKWSSEQVWVLTAIVPDGKIETESFEPTQWVEAAQWIEERQGVANQYFHVNPVRRALNNKASKEDVATLAWLHVDIDPRAGEDIAEEQDRILRLLRDYSPKPTVIISSGGGLQGFFKLVPDDRLVIDGNVAKAQELEAYNVQLEKVFQADHCHNCDRIMRLPGTVNLPNAKKRKQGRVPALATLVEWDDDAIYSIDQFTPAAKATATPPRAARRQRVSPPVAEGTGVGVDELTAWATANGKTIKESTLALIATGTDPIDPTKYTSRSEALFRVCCDLVRADVSDDMIFGVITGPNEIAKSVREKPDWKGYAVRQIERAHEDVAKEPPVLHPKTPLRSAREFIAREKPYFLHYNGDWLAYAAAAYAELEDGTVRRDVYHFLEQAKLPPSEKQQEAGLAFGGDFQPDTTSVNHVLDALRAVSHRPRDSFNPPCWLVGEGPPAHELVACRNGLLHLPSGELLEHTPRFFTRNALAFDYDVAAPAPDRWLGFLETLWPEEPEAVALLQEVFGYVLIPDTSQQKIFLMVGPTRSGKGTIARVLTELVGPPNICAPSLSDFGETFGLESLLGKQLAILSDVRLDGKANHAAIAESLLRISGEDTVTVKRKHRTAWDGRLAVRFLLLSNLMPRFSDASPALANRFVPLLMDQSFLGKEDPDLTGKLLAELPGILNWAVEGWRRLHERGRFALPPSSRDAIQQLIELAAPVATFLREECELDIDAEVPKTELFERWKDWCIRNGSLPGALNSFSAQLYGATSARVRSKKSRRGDDRLMVFAGLRLKEAAEKPSPRPDEKPPF